MRGGEAWKLAGLLARKIGMVPTGANVQTIRLAIEAEADYSGASLDEAAEVITKAAKEFTRAHASYRVLADWEHREIFRDNAIDRFWFEDARWRAKVVYEEFRAALRDRCGSEEATA